MSERQADVALSANRLSRQRTSAELAPTSLSDALIASPARLAAAAFVLLIGHGVYLSSLVASRGQPPDVALLWAVVIPMIVLGLWDFRSALLLSVVATPFFQSPAVPHFFTQGLGDLFAAAASAGFLLRYRTRAFALLTWPNALLMLLPAAALSSILANAATSGAVAWSDIKYEIAELAGVGLAVVYALILASMIRSARDMRLLITAVWLAISIALAHSLVSIGLVTECVSGLRGTLMSRGGQVTAAFSNPNYYASWLLAVAPVVLWQLETTRGRGTGPLKATALVVLCGFLLLTVSRSALLTLCVLLVGWLLLASGWRARSLAVMGVLGLAVFFSSAWNYRFEMCRSERDRTLMQYVVQSSALSLFMQGDLSAFVTGKTTETLQEQLDQDGRRHPGRVELLRFAYDSWKENPIFGIGPGTMAKKVEDATRIGERAHNVLATVVAEQGAVGLAAWLVLWLALLRKIWRLYRHESARGAGIAKGKYVLLAFITLSITSLFADQYRVIWLWTFVGVALSQYFSSQVAPAPSAANPTGLELETK